MYLTSEKKAEIFEKHGGKAENTGSAEGQVALFTYRINHLTSHLKKNHKDYATERSLVKMVGKRKRLLDYLKKKDITRYRAIIAELGLRK
ncbi:30S ribosomal protein S15 [Planobacterium oryzisoli]|uniref:Small ribosomal subunit protein uS15 n=1 Tax=Planobacterium oryzisoli TaxID=2771435 RepID=A0A930YWZ5_9FLAO|nr:30S ribosomal protein S15 [Planobacterium oryzisoli]MBF5027974.1 30S ribosomal protein S15 [Planobacterium oryzisoli]